MADLSLEVRDFEARRGAFRVALPELRLAPGEAAALVGPSGCGKTTLLLALLGLARDVATHGQVTFDGIPWPAPGTASHRRLLRERVALILQDARAALDPLATLGAQLQAVTGASPAACEAALADFGVETPAELLGRPPHQVSGGQAQRVLLAIAALRRPALVVADEPSASLDGARTTDLVRELQKLRERTGTALLLATHDLELVRALGARTFVIEDGVARERALLATPWPRWQPASTGDVVLRAQGLGVARNGRWLLRGVDLELRAGDALAITGTSGSGKTTLARALAGFVPASEGVIERPPRRAAVQMLFQDAHGSLTPGRSIRGLVRETAADGFDPDGRARALGLDPALLARSSAELSGGERRRAALLRALSVRPAVLILDEPTASLDRQTALAVVAAMLALQQEGVALLWITHDLELAGAVADRIITLERGSPVRVTA